jgi:hypothetical protein
MSNTSLDKPPKVLSEKAIKAASTRKRNLEIEKAESLHQQEETKGKYTELRSSRED